MRVAILDDVHQTYESTSAIRRLRERAEVQIFIAPFGDPATLRDASAALLGAEWCDLDHLMRASDIVSVHATLAPETQGLLNARRLGLMKRSAYLIVDVRKRCGRGQTGLENA